MQIRNIFRLSYDKNNAFCFNVSHVQLLHFLPVKALTPPSMWSCAQGDPVVICIAVNIKELIILNRNLLAKQGMSPLTNHSQYKIIRTCAESNKVREFICKKWTNFITHKYTAISNFMKLRYYKLSKYNLTVHSYILYWYFKVKGLSGLWLGHYRKWGANVHLALTIGPKTNCVSSNRIGQI